MTDPTYTDEDVRALANVINSSVAPMSLKGLFGEGKTGSEVALHMAQAALDHLLAHGWDKRADVLEDVAIGVRDTINGAYPKEANEALLAVAEAIMEEAKDARHSSAKATEDRP